MDVQGHMQLLTVTEVATLLRLKVSTIRAWLLEGRLTYVKLGRRVFLRRSDIEDLVTSSVVRATIRGEDQAAIAAQD